MKAILFVDDKEVLCQLTCDILRLEGYRAVPAYNAAEALKVFDEENFDIVVPDLRMQGMNGLELARKIHNKVCGRKPSGRSVRHMSHSVFSSGSQAGKSPEPCGSGLNYHKAGFMQPWPWVGS